MCLRDNLFENLQANGLDLSKKEPIEASIVWAMLPNYRNLFFEKLLHPPGWSRDEEGRQPVQEAGFAASFQPGCKRLKTSDHIHLLGTR